VRLFREERVVKRSNDRVSKSPTGSKKTNQGG
jgi:hypothetical protein